MAEIDQPYIWTISIWKMRSFLSARHVTKLEKAYPGARVLGTGRVFGERVGEFASEMFVLGPRSMFPKASLGPNLPHHCTPALVPTEVETYEVSRAFGVGIRVTEIFGHAMPYEDAAIKHMIPISVGFEWPTFSERVGQSILTGLRAIPNATQSWKYWSGKMEKEEAAAAAAGLTSSV